MSAKLAWIEHPGLDRGNSGAHSAEINVGIALMGVYHIDSTPVPKLQVDLPRPILMVPSDHQLGSRRRQLRREIEWPLLSHSFDHSFAHASRGKFTHTFDN